MKIKSLVFILFLSIVCVHSQRRRRNINNNTGLNAIRNGISPQKMMSLYDKNNDGAIDREEAAAIDIKGFLDKFDEIDSNNDDVIDVDELRKIRKRRRKNKKAQNIAKLIKEMDVNEDGKLDEFEIALKENIKLRSNFKKIDTNADGFIDFEELDIFFKNE